jgi:HEPN domain-containing protein
MSGLEPPGSPENRREARQWLAIVEADIDVARAAGRLSPPRLGHSAYHLQQAAEKLLKALLVLNSEPFRHTHDLDDLIARLSPFYPRFTDVFEQMRPLSTWSVAFRYPGLEDLQAAPPAIAEVERLAAMLGAFANEARALVGNE